ncbi:sensor histidine kinase [Lactonifactor longoviformis]|uniref:sensor histidine kinase n=1 Tax=Lactonifactor longoviformis TaxID=341220 RepID=UPI0036F3107F
MSFLHEKQSRCYFLFLSCFCTLMLAFFVLCAGIQTREAKKLLLRQEQTAASYLLEQGISEDITAAAFKNSELTEEGVRLLEKSGRTDSTPFWLLPPARRAAVLYLTAALLGGLGFGGILMGVSAFFLHRRELLYQKAAGRIAEFAEGSFARHLPRNETGTLYQLFASVDELAMALQSKSESEQKAKEFLKDMISDISHQLKTPLAALNMYAEIILDEPDNPPLVEEFSGKSLISLARMEQLILSLLKVMRLDAGNIRFEQKLCTVSELVSRGIAELITRAKQEEKQILINGDPGEQILCDLEWTGEAIGNLVKNALDHTEAGGTIEIAWERSLAMLRLSVADNGSGILPEDIHHIFKRFYRSKSSAHTQGIGLGLPLAKSIIEGQGGILSLQSTPGKGTTFIISFLTEP